jgi:hypothetical protein
MCAMEQGVPLARQVMGDGDLAHGAAIPEYLRPVLRELKC